ncbi:Dabb family protein [Sulfurimonas sp. SAG-AH-194-I05]|nr:Dabb family protein [Sulfurimonas sp. SAG-AH-194-I05]MDF1874667.1 Dabb family protein [Sulfurimonas sp. SAG-AH-194-I05]
MIVHIVMFKFNEKNKEENLQIVKEKLEQLVEKIPTLLSIEVGIDFNQSERAFDLSLYSTFNTKEDLQEYAAHTEHVNVVTLIKSVTCGAKVVDYTLS